MNVCCQYKNSEYKLEIAKSSQVSQIYDYVQKIHNIPLERLKIYNGETLLPNNSNHINDYINSNSCKLKIIDIEKEKETEKETEDNFNNKIKIISKKIIDNPLKYRLKSLNTNYFIKCQMCKKKDSIIYCRKCNKFNCFECNVKYPEHLNHLIINLEKGNLSNTINYYKKELVKEINSIEKAYNKSNQWMISDEIRKEYLDNLIKLIQEIGTKTQKLSNLKSENNEIDFQILGDLKKEILNIEKPNFNEYISVFTEIHEKDKEVSNFIDNVNYQIIKSKFNKNLIELFEEIQNYLVTILNDAQNKYDDIIDLTKNNYKLIESYLNEDEKFEIKKENLFPYINTIQNTESNLLNNNNINETASPKHRKNYLSNLIEYEKLKTENSIHNISLKHNLGFSSHNYDKKGLLDNSSSERDLFIKKRKSNIYEKNSKLKRILSENSRVKTNLPKNSTNTIVDMRKISQILKNPAKKKKKK